MKKNYFKETNNTSIYTGDMTEYDWGGLMSWHDENWPQASFYCPIDTVALYTDGGASQSHYLVITNNHIDSVRIYMYDGNSDNSTGDNNKVRLCYVNNSTVSFAYSCGSYYETSSRGEYDESLSLPASYTGTDDYSFIYGEISHCKSGYCSYIHGYYVYSSYTRPED
jgi:hypothetical protein